MKLEVGMYVRTRDGFLWKPKKIEIEEDNSVWFDDYYDFDVSDVKASHNIIDLIEVGDYVNGFRVVYINHKYEYLEVSDEEYIINKEDIKTIVTKEQFESMSYKI